MQQMQEPEGRPYNEGYSQSTGYPVYQDDEQARWSQLRDDSQQKLQPENGTKLSTINVVLAILSVVASSFIMAFSITLVTLTANIFGRTIGVGAIKMLSNSVFGIIIASFVFSLILLLFSIAGFVFSVIQLSIIGKKRKRERSIAWSRLK